MRLTRITNWLPLAAIFLVLSTQYIFAQATSFPIESKTSPKFWLDKAVFQGENGQSQVEIYYSIANDELTFTNSAQGKLATISVSFTVKDSLNQIIYTEDRRRGVRANSLKGTHDKSRGLIDQFVFPTQPGGYTLVAKLKDDQSTEISSITSHIVVSSFGDDLCMSDPQLATVVTSNQAQGAFSKSDWSVFPNPARRYKHKDSVLYLYLEIYHLSALEDTSDSNLQLGYSVKSLLGDTLLVIPRQPVAKPKACGAIVEALDIRSLDRGEYILKIEAQEESSGNVISTEKRFWIYEPELETQILSMTDTDIQKYRDQIKYLATKEELQLFEDLDAKGKETFLLNFWKSKDETPETPENEFMQNYFARIDYANKHFKGRDGGANSDMGRVFIIYGQPDDIERHNMEFDTKPYTIWYYFYGGGKHSFAFVDRNNEGIYALVHSTVEEEIKNYYWKEQELR